MRKKFVNDLPGGDYAGFTDMREVDEFVNNQVTIQGAQLACGVGQNQLPIQLGGDAEFLLGIIMYDDSGDPNNKISLVINNKKRLVDVNQCFASRTFGDPAVFQSAPFPKHFVPVPTPLSKGTDSITVQYECLTECNMFIAFYYIS